MSKVLAAGRDVEPPYLPITPSTIHNQFLAPWVDGEGIQH